MNNSEKSAEYMSNGYNCSQSVFSTLGPLLGLDKDTCLKIGTGFGGGMASMQKTCGAVTGAFMAIGLKYGNIDAKDKESKGKTYELVKKFKDEFEKINGSISCRDLIGHDTTTEEGLKYAQANKLYSNCPKFVMDSVNITEKILNLTD
ncbi:MAG: C_GCAxxG_C_C family protein [archaeon]|nr:C_GCAxxG_C_C family protein [archaeon]